MSSIWMGFLPGYSVARVCPEGLPIRRMSGRHWWEHKYAIANSNEAVLLTAFTLAGIKRKRAWHINENMKDWQRHKRRGRPESWEIVE